MVEEEYRRGWEDCLDVLYYRLLRKGVTDTRGYEVIAELQTSVKEDKINRLMNELGLL